MRRLRAVHLIALGFLVVSSCTRAPDIVRMPADPPTVVLIEDVTVLDVEDGSKAPHRDVLVEKGRIARIVPTGHLTLPEGGERIDGRGATLLPGLIDMHTHVSSPTGPPWVVGLPNEDANLQGFLYAGVTTVLDTGSMAPDAYERRDRIARGEQLGPTTYEAGPIVTARGGHPVAIFSESLPALLGWYVLPRMTREVDTPQEGQAAAADIVGMGADVMKVVVDRIPSDVPRITNEALAAAVGEARKHDVRAVAHIGNAQDAIDAADAGVAAWVHGVYKERLSDEQVAKLAAYGIPMAPTLVVFESFAGFGKPYEATDLERESSDPEALAAMNDVPEDFDLSGMNRLGGTLAGARENVRRLHDAGVTILAGSDTQSGLFAGASLHREVGLLVEAGLTPADAIRAATLDPARFLARTQVPPFGVVKEGRVADLLLVEGDPTADIGNLSRIRAVLKGGVPLERIPRTAG